MIDSAGNLQHGRIRTTASKLCSMESWKRRLPITIWLPKYKFEYLLRDAIAGITVGLTSIPQGIAYAMVAGLPPQVGLYSSIFPGLVYMLFGSCKDVTVGPTAILAALLSKYVAKSPDFAYLAAFLSGCLILLLGVLQLGFLLDFISKPVISGFTTAAALQISASQLKPLFRIAGSSGDTFVEAMINFFKHLKTIQLWDTLLGISTIIALILLKRATMKVTESSPPRRVRAAAAWLTVVRARNALVVLAASILAFVLHYKGLTPFTLTGTIQGGLPKFGLPPFSTVVNNQTLDLDGMLGVFGAEGLVMPLVAVLESIAIAKAFAGRAAVDATQEMVAVGLGNVAASLAGAMPAAGSFTRTALNHSCGVATPAGCAFKAMLVLLAVTLLSDAFYFIPRATLAGIIVVAMFSLLEVNIVRMLWRNSKCELCVWAVTAAGGAALGLEYGIVCGAVADLARLLLAARTPRLAAHHFKVGSQDCVSVVLPSRLWFVCAARLGEAIHIEVPRAAALVVLDASHLFSMDLAVCEAILSVILDLEKDGHKVLLWNFKDSHQRLMEDLQQDIGTRFVNGTNIDHHILVAHNVVSPTALRTTSRL